MDKIKNQQKERIFKTVSSNLTDFGFHRTKSTFWVKELSNTIQFIHIHTFSSNYSFRIHLAVRVKNDSFDAASLNGPCSYDGWWKTEKLFRNKRELVFNEQESSVTFCAKNIIDYVKTIGLPWFLKYADENELLNNQDSPLCKEEKAVLVEMINGISNKKNFELSNEILRLDKLKNTKPQK